MNALISNIQRFSLHDGPGIRTTVFFKGCSLHCPWCSNPENIAHSKQSYLKGGVSGEYGNEYDGNALYDIVMKDRIYYEGKLSVDEFQITESCQIDDLPGGVTFSGGEPLLFLPFFDNCIQKLRKEGIHLCVESSLFVSASQLEYAIENIDFFYVDIKIMDSHKCKDVLGGNLNNYQDNVNRLLDSNKTIIFRIPVIGEYTDTEENVRCVISQLNPWYGRGNVLKIELIKGHNLSREKYISLGMPLPPFTEVSDAFMESYKNRIQAIGYDVDICKI